MGSSHSLPAHRRFHRYQSSSRLDDLLPLPSTPPPDRSTTYRLEPGFAPTPREVKFIHQMGNRAITSSEIRGLALNWYLEDTHQFGLWYRPKKSAQRLAATFAMCSKITGDGVEAANSAKAIRFLLEYDQLLSS